MEPSGTGTSSAPESLSLASSAASSSLAAAAAPVDSLPSPDPAELMRDLDSYDPETLDRLLQKLAAKSDQRVNSEGERVQREAVSPATKESTPEFQPPPSLFERLMAIFPDACPDWVRQEAAKFEASVAPTSLNPMDCVDPEPLVTLWLSRGYRKRIKKWRQQLAKDQMETLGRESHDNGLQAAAAAAAAAVVVAVSPDDGTIFDWRGRHQELSLRQPMVDTMIREFPLVGNRSLSQVSKAFKYNLPSAYRFVCKILALTGNLAASSSAISRGESGHLTKVVSVNEAMAAALASDDAATFTNLPFDCPMTLELRTRGSRQWQEELGERELEMRHPELLDELRFVRSLMAEDRTVAAAGETLVDNGSSGAGPSSSSASAVLGSSVDLASGMFECECCFSDFPIDTMCQCPDGHLFCRPCLAAYAKEQAFGTGRLSLTCLAPNCDHGFPRSQLTAAVDAATLTKLDERAAEDSVRCLSSALFRCPACGWAAEVGDEPPTEMAVNKVFACQNCEKEVCRVCGVDWEEHFGKRCSEIERDPDVRLRREFEEKMTEAKVRICYQCRASVIKNGGCNHISCRCGAHFCYVCRAAVPVQNPYSHFCNHGNRGNCQCGLCPVQSSTEEDDQRAVKEIQAQGLKRQREEGLQERPIGAPDQPSRKRPRYD